MTKSYPNSAACGPKNAPAKLPLTVPVPIRTPAKPGFTAPREPNPTSVSSGVEAPPGARALDIKPYVTSSLNTNKTVIPRVINAPDAMAGLDVKGSVVASDAFFPFADGLVSAVGAGATAAIQPGGSMRDAEVIKAADDAGIAMVFTGMRHFRH